MGNSPTAQISLLTNRPLPLYHQLQQALTERIERGEWQPGDQLPTIRELCQQYGVSRMTVVQALSLLSQKGLVTSQQGKGIFVAQPKIEHGPVGLVSFTEEITRRGYTPSSRVLSLRQEPAGVEVADRLQIAPGDSVCVIERLRIADDLPMGVQRAYLPERLFPGLASVTEPIESLYRLLQERYGVAPTAATESYEPALADRATAALLEIRPGSPVFVVERLTRDQRNRVIEWVSSVLRGDRYKVVLRLERL